jgi:hypothetical protein
MIDIQELSDCITDCGLEEDELKIFLYSGLYEMIRDSLEEPKYRGLCLDNEEDRAKLLKYLLPLK